MNMMQQETADQKESGYGNLDAEIPTDDEEVTIPPHDRIKEAPDFPDFNFRDEQTLLNTQREDWLLPTEPGTTSWEQYRQVFEAIVRSNGWDSDTAACNCWNVAMRGMLLI